MFALFFWLIFLAIANFLPLIESVGPFTNFPLIIQPIVTVRKIAFTADYLYAILILRRRIIKFYLISC